MTAADRRRSRWASGVVLGNGETAHIRPIEPGDAAALAALHERQPAENLYRRYFSPKSHLTPAELEHFTNVDFVDRVGLVVEDETSMIAWASYERWAGRDDADCAFLVDDGEQGKGIATLLLEHLATIARANGIKRFTAEVLGDNRAMLSVFGRAGWPVQRRFDSGVVDVEFGLDETPEFLDTLERREQRADSRAMARVLMPRAVAVIGASDQPHSVGRVLWENTVAQARFPVYPVNPNHDTVGGVRSYGSVTEIDDDVTLGVICVSPDRLDATIDDCIAARLRGVLVVTSVEDTEIDLDAIVARSRRHGMRVIGPASMGAGTTHGEIGLNAMLVPMSVAPGGVSISLQSGSLGASLLRAADDLSLGLSWFVSLGDRSDISGNDLLQFFADDESTKVIAMYTETFGNPRKMARIARRVSRQQPIVAVRTGSAAAGVAGGAMYRQAGLIEVPTVRELLDTARVLATQPVMAGPNCAVLTNGESAGTLARAAVAAAGLRPVDPPQPLDWRAQTDDYATALRAAIDDPDIHAVLVLYVPPVANPAGTADDAIHRTATDARIPVVTVSLGRRDGPLVPGSAVPSFSFPEPAAACLGRSYAYHRWRETDALADGDQPGDMEGPAIEAIVDRALEADRRELTIEEANDLLRAAGIAVPPTVYVEAVDAPAAADAIGGPVVIKARRRHVGRSAQAGIALDVKGRLAVAEAVATMRAAIGDDADYVAVQRMVTPGFDVRIRVVTDPAHGPVVGVGLAGFSADLLADDSTMLAPLTDAQARELLRTSGVATGLERNGLPTDAIVEVVERCARLATDHPEIAEIDVNPAIVSAEACWVTDARILVVPTPDPEQPLRRLV